MINYFDNNNDNLYFAKVKPNAIIPNKNTEDSGYDIYSCFEEDYIIINPHETKMIPTGIASACSTDYCLILKERGSTGTKGIGQRSGIIDSGFRGEWFVPITNHNNVHMIMTKECNNVEWRYTVTGKDKTYSCVILEGEKVLGEFNTKLHPLENPPIVYPFDKKAICQALVVPVPKMDVREISYEELKSIPSKRGVGALGSSGK